MRPNIPRAWDTLPNGEKKKIVEYVQSQYNAQLDHEEAEMQKVWLKMMCIANYDVLKTEKTEAIMVLARWKRLYHIISKCKSAEERDAYLNEQIDKIFGVGGYPQEWVDKLEDQ